MTKQTGYSWIPVAMLTLMVGLILAISGCSKRQSASSGGTNAPTKSSAAGDTIRIAVVAPITGSDAEFGQDAANGAQLAVDEANGKGGVLGKQLELVVMDDKADPKEGANAANKIASDSGFVAVVGHINSGTTIPSEPIYNRAGIAMVTPSSTNPRITEQGFNNVFRVCITDAVQGPFAAQLAVKDMKKKSFAVLHDKTAYGQGIAESFQDEAKKLGANVMLFEGITKGDTDFHAVLTKIQALKPDAIYYAGMSPEGGLIAAQSKSVGLRATMISPDGCFAPQFIKIGSEGAEGAIVTFLAPPWDKDPNAAGFVHSYSSKYGDIKNYAPFGYDAAWVAIDGIAKAKKADRAAVIAALHDPSFTHKGITGEIKFDKKGDVIGRVPYVYIVRNGKFELYRK